VTAPAALDRRVADRCDRPSRRALLKIDQLIA
jgi:hypothetical protein